MYHFLCKILLNYLYIKITDIAHHNKKKYHNQLL